MQKFKIKINLMETINIKKSVFNEVVEELNLWGHEALANRLKCGVILKKPAKRKINKNPFKEFRVTIKQGENSVFYTFDTEVKTDKFLKDFKKSRDKVIDGLKISKPFENLRGLRKDSEKFQKAKQDYLSELEKAGFPPLEILIENI